jgi:hypothetical protein
LGVSSALNMN